MKDGRLSSPRTDGTSALQPYVRDVAREERATLAYLANASQLAWEWWLKTLADKETER